MQTTLGLSITSTSVGWVLVDSDAPDAAILDHDAFELQTATADSHLLAAARGAQAIATAGGHHLTTIGVTWSDHVDVEHPLVVQSLKDMGFENVVPVRPARAAQTLAHRFGRQKGYAKTAICLIEHGSASVIVAGVDDGRTRTAATSECRTSRAVTRWLTTILSRSEWHPEALFVIGSQTSRDGVQARLESKLSTRVFASSEAQLSLALGAALASQYAEEAKTWPPSWLPARSEALLALVTCVIALVATAVLFPAHGSRPAQERQAAVPAASPTTIAPPSVKPAPAAQLTPMAEQIPPPVLQATPAATVSMSAPDHTVVDEQPTPTPAPLAQHEPVDVSAATPPPVPESAPSDSQGLNPLFSPLP